DQRNTFFFLQNSLFTFLYFEFFPFNIFIAGGKQKKDRGGSKNIFGKFHHNQNIWQNIQINPGKPDFFCCFLLKNHSFIRAITSIPPFVLSPILQRISVSKARKTSILEPNFMKPYSCPALAVSPSLQ